MCHGLMTRKMIRTPEEHFSVRRQLKNDEQILEKQIQLSGYFKDF